MDATSLRAVFPAPPPGGVSPGAGAARARAVRPQPRAGAAPPRALPETVRAREPRRAPSTYFIHVFSHIAYAIIVL